MKIQIKFQVLNITLFQNNTKFYSNYLVRLEILEKLHIISVA